MPPEFVEKQIGSIQYDIYSLGIVMIEIITGIKYDIYSLGSHEMFSKDFIDRVRFSSFLWEYLCTDIFMVISCSNKIPWVFCINFVWYVFQFCI